MKTLIATLMICAAGGALAQDPDAGHELYMDYCASCHGVDADGKGPFATGNNANVPALTGLAQANEGEFPMLDVIHVIDGRTGLRGHGGPMPIFGALFRSQMSDRFGRYGEVIETRGRILSIAYYLESIQQ